MSRLALKPITIPEKTTVTLDSQGIKVVGPKGTLTQFVPSGVSVALKDNTVKVTRVAPSIQAHANLGLTHRLIENMLVGVTTGFNKKLELVGTGYRAKKQGTGLSISAGFSHPVDFTAPSGITLESPTETVILVSGFDKQLVGQVAADIRAIRPPEPYKGKGIRYSGELIRRKAGKTTKVGAA